MRRYQQAIQVISSFFAILLGIGLRRLLDNPHFDPQGAVWPCFLLSVFLFLRLLLWSSTHMWFEYVKDDRAQDSTFRAPRWQIINDFLFLTVLGLIGMGICYAQDLDAFLTLNLLFTGVGMVWVFLYWLVTKIAVLLKKPIRGPRGDWNYYGWISLVQFVSVVVVMKVIVPLNWGTIATVPWWPTTFIAQPTWEGPEVLLVIVYLALLAVDFWKQLRVLESVEPRG